LRVERLMDIQDYLKEKRELIDSYLKSYFDNLFEPFVLHEAMTYSLFAGGKRIRPILVLASYEACGKNPEDIISQAAALELIHTYSLIHDDLPSMDNDNLRRGRPTNHKVFGEAMAVLAGDALLTEAFHMMTNSNTPYIKSRMCELSTDELFTIIPASSRRNRVRAYSDVEIKPSSLIKVVKEVALAAGACGMVGGQAQDILSEKAKADEKMLRFIHLHKTAALIKASVKIGGILAEAGERKMKALTKYGENIGLAFQIIDDILDVEGTTEELGKDAGSDELKKKMTYPSFYGLKAARKKARDLSATAVEALHIFSHRANFLREIAVYLIERRA